MYGGYFRRWFGNFLVTDDLNHAASDYESFSITPGSIPALSGIGRRRRAAEQHLHPAVLMVQKPGTISRRKPVRWPLRSAVSWQQRHRPLERVRLQPQCQARPRGHPPGWHEHRAAGHRHLRHRWIQPTPASSATGRRCRAADRRWARGQLAQLLCRDAGLADAAEVPRRRTRCRKSTSSWARRIRTSPASSWRATYAEPNSDIARPVSQGGLGHLPFAGGLGDGDDDPGDHSAGDRLLQSTEPAGSSPWEDSEIRRQDPGEPEPGPLQPVQQGHHHWRELRTYTTWLAPSSVIAPRLAKVSMTFDF